MTGAGRGILLGRGGLDLEGDGLIAGVGKAQDLGDFVGEGACISRSVSRLVEHPAKWPRRERRRARIRLKPSSEGSSSTDMARTDLVVLAGSQVEVDGVINRW